MSIENTQDVIDSRDIIDRIAELEAEGEEALDEDERGELVALKDLALDGETNVPDWPYGETLIRDDYFVTYAQQLADDIGATNSDQGWPLGFIDWDAAADALKMDYTELDFDGVTYWARG